MLPDEFGWGFCYGAHVVQRFKFGHAIPTAPKMVNLFSAQKFRLRRGNTLLAAARTVRDMSKKCDRGHLHRSFDGEKSCYWHARRTRNAYTFFQLQNYLLKTESTLI
jgi:hypothetical protein